MVQVFDNFSEFRLCIIQISKFFGFGHFSMVKVKGFQHSLVFYMKFSYMSNPFLEMVDVFPAVEPPEKLLDNFRLVAVIDQIFHRCLFAQEQVHSVFIDLAPEHFLDEDRRTFHF